MRRLRDHSIRSCAVLALGLALAQVTAAADGKYIQLNKEALQHAEQLIGAGKFVVDERDDWRRDKPPSPNETEFIRHHGIAAYGRWYLAVNPASAKRAKGRYKFPYGDFEKVHRCGLLEVKKRAQQYGDSEIENAATRLLDLIDKTTAKASPTPRETRR